MPRDQNGRYKSAEADTPKSSETDDALIDKFFALLERLVERRNVLAAAILLGTSTASYFGVLHAPELLKAFGKTENALPETATIWTYDSSEPDPAKRIQHKDVKLTGSDTIHGTYAYREIKSHGVISGFRRIGGNTILLTYASEDPKGDSLGSIVLRPLRYVNEGAPVVWVGFETGHDCTCAKDMAHDGPFTSVPAILTGATSEPTSELQELVKKVETNPERFMFPDDIQKALKK
jgi:hypothetical protein